PFCCCCCCCCRCCWWWCCYCHCCCCCCCCLLLAAGLDTLQPPPELQIHLGRSQTHAAPKQRASRCPLRQLQHQETPQRLLLQHYQRPEETKETHRTNKGDTRYTKAAPATGRLQHQ